MLSVSKLRLVVAFFLFGWALGLSAGEMKTAGPEGGDVRKLAVVPDNPDRIYLGTSSGRLYVSDDRGQSWTRFAHLGDGFDYVLDNIEIDPTNSNIMYVAGWSIEGNTGEVFRSHDGGLSWTSLSGIRGKSVRALHLAPSNPKILVAGAIDGVYRSDDGGNHWKRISPESNASLKNIGSIAIDPKNPDTVYAGTFHLAWKTTDGGGTWHQINRGMIDDSDVFSIIVDPKSPNVVYASACSGIYSSQTAGELFKKAPGIPFSSRRTRVLKQDPRNPSVVYAGTTEGLWRTDNAGLSWKRISAANVTVNDVLIHPTDPNLILLATDRIGVLRSTNGAKAFVASNHGFTHRQVASIMVDEKNPNKIYAGTLNDHEYGGVFVSDDGGTKWQQMSTGLGGHDVFKVSQDPKGTLYAATNGGLFRYNTKARLWMKVLPARMDSHLRVSDLDLNGPVWYLATQDGVYESKNSGTSWAAVASLGKQSFISVQSNGKVIAAAGNSKVFESTNNGHSWQQIHIPLVSYVSGMTMDANGYVWLNSPEGVYHQVSDGWEKARELPQNKIAVLDFDPTTREVVAINRDSNAVMATNDGHHWRSVFNPGVPVRSVVFTGNQVFAGTKFDGVMKVEIGHNSRLAGDEPSGGN
jgi:photosystem II stability/assembly factor-like uncharacterized protein